MQRRTLLRAAGLGAAGLLGGAAYGALGSGDDGLTRALVAGSLQGVAPRPAGVSVEAHGSAAVRQLLLEDARDPDAVALADPVLFAGIADRTTLFATNALVVVFAPDSPAAPALREDWRAVADPEVSLGRTDPAADPLGYRTVMALQLAARDGLDADATLEHSRIFQETGLIAAVRAGAVDAAVAYRSMAVERDLPYVPLPPAYDFSDPDRADRYASVAVTVDGQRIAGAPITYGATALTEAGEAWVDRLVSGRERLRNAGFGTPADYPRTVAVGED